LCAKLSKSVTETLEMRLETFGEHSLSWTAVFEWHSRFEASQMSVEDYKRSGWPSTSKTTENVEKIREFINKDRHWTIHELAHTVGISYGVRQIITENLNMRRIAPSSQQRPPTHPWKLQSLWLTTTWLSFPILPTRRT
jgi:hypothetical protein